MSMLGNNCDVVGFNFRMKDHRVKVIKLKAPIQRRDAIKFIRNMSCKGYVRQDLSFGILKNGWQV